jgi:hypothetical protein
VKVVIQQLQIDIMHAVHIVGDLFTGIQLDSLSASNSMVTKGELCEKIIDRLVVSETIEIREVKHVVNGDQIETLQEKQ